MAVGRTQKLPMDKSTYSDSPAFNASVVTLFPQTEWVSGIGSALLHSDALTLRDHRLGFRVAMAAGAVLGVRQVRPLHSPRCLDEAGTQPAPSKRAAIYTAKPA